MFNSSCLQPNRIKVLMFQQCWCAEISFYFLFFLTIMVQKIYLLFFSLKIHYNVQLPVSSTKSNRSIGVPAVLIRRNFSSPVMQTATSAEAMPSPASLLPFARLDVNPGWHTTPWHTFAYTYLLAKGGFRLHFMCWQFYEFLTLIHLSVKGL